MAKQEKWINLLISLNRTGQLCNATEFNLFTCTVCDWSFISLMKPHRIHSEALTPWGTWWWYPCIRCHLKCLCVNFTSVFVKNTDLKMISLHYVHSVQKLITNHCAEIHKMANEHLTPEGCLTSSAHFTLGGSEGIAEYQTLLFHTSLVWTSHIADMKHNNKEGN